MSKLSLALQNAIQAVDVEAKEDQFPRREHLSCIMN